MGWSDDPGPSWAGKFPATSFIKGIIYMKELSIFIDESGDYGECNHLSPY